ncbi:MAG TPA: SgcJ/EcaC family oxidoreductase [Sphingomicrobium sp.]
MTKFLALVAMIAASPAVGQPRDRVHDEAAIRAILADTARGFNEQNVTSELAHRTNDVDHINVAGVWAQGKTELRKETVEFFKSHHPRMTVSIEKIRFLTPDVAYAIVKRSYKDEKGTRDSISTSVFQKIKGRWWDVLFQNTFVRPAEQTPPSH